MPRSPVESLNDVLTILQEEAPAIRGLGVARVGVYGSFARGRQSPESDVDIIADTGSSPFSFEQLNALYELLEARIARRLEIITLRSLRPPFKARIERYARFIELGN